MHTRMQDWARTIRTDAVTLYYAARDPRVPLLAKAIGALAAAYALSPIDLIPDFIPLLGLLDDLIVVPLAIVLAARIIPKDVMGELRAKAEARLADPRGSWVGAVIVLVLWALGILLLYRLFAPNFQFPDPGSGTSA